MVRNVYERSSRPAFDPKYLWISRQPLEWSRLWLPRSCRHHSLSACALSIIAFLDPGPRYPAFDGYWIFWTWIYRMVRYFKIRDGLCQCRSNFSSYLAKCQIREEAWVSRCRIILLVAVSRIQFDPRETMSFVLLTLSSLRIIHQSPKFVCRIHGTTTCLLARWDPTSTFHEH